MSPRTASPGRSRLLPATAIALLLGFLSAAAAPSHADAHPLVTGITNLHSSDPLAFRRTRDAGAELVRVPLDWGLVAPAERPDGWQAEDPASAGYDWSETDIAVANATRAGLTPVIHVDGAPRWAQRCVNPEVLPAATCDPEPAALRAFATAAARRYSGAFAGIPRVKLWQAMNEPNLSIYFFPQFDTKGRALSPGLYRQLVNAFSAGVKGVDDSNLVIAAGLGPVGRPPWTIGPLRFARELLCMRGRKHPRPAPGSCDGGVDFDVFAIQPYTTGGPTHTGGADDVELGDLGKLQTLIAAADKAGRIKGRFKRTPLWITEFSWDSKPPDPGGLPMKTLTRWTAEALHTAWSAGVDHFLWYSLFDGERTPGLPYSQTLESGLYFRAPTLAQQKPKRVLYAFRFPFVAYATKNGLSFWGRTPDSRSGKVTIQVMREGGWGKATTVQADRNGIFHGVAHSTYGHNQEGSARARFGAAASVPFAMRPIHDFYQPPFG